MGCCRLGLGASLRLLAGTFLFGFIYLGFEMPRTPHRSINQGVSLLRYMEQRFTSMERAVDKAAVEMARRLDNFPEEYMTKAESEKVLEIGRIERLSLKEKIDLLRDDIARLKAKDAAIGKVIALTVTVTAIVVTMITAVIASLLRLWKV